MIINVLTDIPYTYELFTRKRKSECPNSARLAQYAQLTLFVEKHRKEEAVHQRVGAGNVPEPRG